MGIDIKHAVRQFAPVLYVDYTNNRVGIGTSTPGGLLHLELNVSAGETLRIARNSSLYTTFGAPGGSPGRTVIRVNGIGSDILRFYNEAGGSIEVGDFSVNGFAFFDVSNDTLCIGAEDPAAASSILDLRSTNKGFLPPRMTTAQKNAIGSPAAGLTVYDTDLAKLCVYTTAWETITSS